MLEPHRPIPGSNPNRSPVIQSPATGSARVQDLRRQIDELKQSWPAHSTPAAMLQRLEELEEELENELRSEG